MAHRPSSLLSRLETPEAVAYRVAFLFLGGHADAALRCVGMSIMELARLCDIS